MVKVSLFGSEGRDLVKGAAVAKRGTVAAIAAALSVSAGMASAASPTFEYSGYIRQHMSVNLQDTPSFSEKSATNLMTGTTDIDRFGGKWDLQMSRTSAKLDATLGFGDVGVFKDLRFVGVGRVVREQRTHWERKLQNSGFDNPIRVSDENLGPMVLGLVNANLADCVTAGLCPPGTTVTPVIPTNIGTLGLLGALPPLFGGGGAPVAIPSAGNVNDPTGGPVVLGSDFAHPVTGRNYGSSASFLDEYDDEEFRELYVRFSMGDRYHFKLGRQQVVWGETDFFRAMDIIHGYDLRWRGFLELENEELRKPLILANIEIDVPELDGVLQFIYRPGWDKGEDIGDQLMLEGGRWGPQPWLGTNVTGSLIGRYNYHHEDGDEDDANYGFRWSGTWNQIGYSFAYYRGLSTDGLVVRNPVLGGAQSWGSGFEGPIDQLTELMFPMVETYGFTFNAYSGALDAVIRGELAFTPNKPYNTGDNTFVDLGAFGLGCDDRALAPAGPAFAGACTVASPFGGTMLNPLLDVSGTGFTAPAGVSAALPVLRNSPDFALGAGYIPGNAGPGAPAALTLPVPGVGPIKEKDTLKIMIGMDKNLNWSMKYLGTARPGFWTLQLFDTWVLNHDEDDDLLELFGFGAERREHTMYLTNAFVFNYDYDNINPGLAFGVDLGNGDAFVIPSLDLAFGDHWRLRLEADIFLPHHKKEDNFAVPENNTRLLGTFNNHDQFVARLTYQF